MSKEEEDLKAAGDLISRPWLSGRPYYCVVCGAGGEEVDACAESGGGPCEMETKEEAERRRAKFDSSRARGL